MINPNIATKGLQNLSQMAQSNCYHGVREENVEDMSRTEWKVSSRLALGFLMEILAKLYLSEGTVLASSIRDSI